MTDEHLIDFVLSLGRNLEERIDVLQDMMAYGHAGSMTTNEWLALANIYKMLCEERIRLRKKHGPPTVFVERTA